MPRVIDETGNRYGRLLVMTQATEVDKYKRAKWLCRCDCGEDTIVVGSNLRNGNTRSCGCLKKEKCIAIGRANALPNGEAALGRLIEHYQREARIRGIIFDLSREEFRLITSQPCHYCGALPEQVIDKSGLNGGYVYNGIDRRNNKEGYTAANILPCCKICNRAKRELPYEEFCAYLDRMVMHRG